MNRHSLTPALLASLLLSATNAFAQPAPYCSLDESDPFASLRSVLETDPGAALAAALANDATHTVSRADAERIVNAAIAAIGVSADPSKTHANNQRILAGALALTSSTSARTEFAGYDGLANAAVTDRLDELEGERPVGQLPPDAARALRSVFEGTTVTISDVTGGSGDFYEARYRAGDRTGLAYLSRAGSNWIASPVKLTRANLEAATAALRNHYRTEFASSLEDITGAQLDELVGSLYPERVIWPGTDYSDPLGFHENYPVVFESGDPSGSDNAFYVGFDPATGDSEVGDFN